MAKPSNLLKSKRLKVYQMLTNMPSIIREMLYFYNIVNNGSRKRMPKKYPEALGLIIKQVPYNEWMKRGRWINFLDAWTQDIRCPVHYRIPIIQCPLILVFAGWDNQALSVDFREGGGPNLGDSWKHRLNIRLLTHRILDILYTTGYPLLNVWLIVIFIALKSYVYNLI